jgi:hypothetical protein
MRVWHASTTLGRGCPAERQRLAKSKGVVRRRGEANRRGYEGQPGSELYRLIMKDIGVVEAGRIEMDCKKEIA